ncbi:hypothetical protein [Paraglaciecola hydrolytica]|uniref:Uncharacterized protein n=1 Tax=Paraglaciecola hydrolytica TaxID=1799789 RepID=A0A136A4X7_9ALTE|nr:hypothetical protein [Paraglaciecola hydrolytica]KXI30271.1 hypothetical protein AX660_09825 [Paraglaciecola hydrolytica]
MQNDSIQLYQQEWTTLQNQFDSYEKFSLVIKLLNISLSSLLLFYWQAGLWTVLVTGMLWLQDAIWKTFQDRINQRLLLIEEALKQALTNNESEEVLPLQFNQSWSLSRSSVTSLFNEYLTQALKPTVAYPHVALIALSLLFGIF